MKSLLPDYQFRLWDDEDNLRIIAEHLPQHLAAYKKITKGVAQADIARCVYMLAYGGFYFDTDYKLIRRIEDTLLDCDCILPVSRNADDVQTGYRLGNAVFGSSRGHPFWKAFLDWMFEVMPLADLSERTIEKSTGPEAITDFVTAAGSKYSITFPQKNIFHPITTRFGLAIETDDTTVGVHLCWGSWRSKDRLRNVINFAVRKISAVI